jgi:hypothetical protein
MLMIHVLFNASRLLEVILREHLIYYQAIISINCEEDLMAVCLMILIL